MNLGETFHMRSLMALCLIAPCSSLAGSGVAAAQTTFNVAAGHQVRVHWAFSLNPDCSSRGKSVVRITQAPEHGRVVIRNGTAFPNFPSSNSHSVCNTRRVPAVEAYYQPAPGYTGFDTVGFETIFASGNYRQDTANIQVR